MKVNGNQTFARVTETYGFNRKWIPVCSVVVSTPSLYLGTVGFDSHQTVGESQHFSKATMFTFKKLRDRLYELRFDDSHEMCMTFLRYQEFYESPRYVGRKFTLAEFISWYVKCQSKDGTFSYPQDWGGFNIPVRIIQEVNDLGIDDQNHYDEFMWAISRMISTQCDDAYLIGVEKSGKLDVHEMTHAMFHIDTDYRNKVLATLNLFQYVDLVGPLRNVLINNGYADVTSLDEVNAYLVTDDCGYFDDFSQQPVYIKLQAELRALHDLYYPVFIKDIS